MEHLTLENAPPLPPNPDIPRFPKGVLSWESGPVLSLDCGPAMAGSEEGL